MAEDQLPSSHTWLVAPARPWMWRGLGVALGLCFGYLSHWVIFEYDVFWQVRAGAEILAGNGVQPAAHSPLAAQAGVSPPTAIRGSIFSGWQPWSTT